MDSATFSTYFRGLKNFQTNVLKKLRHFECGATECFFAHQKYALIVMLGDDNEEVREAKVLAHQIQVVEEIANNDECSMH